MIVADFVLFAWEDGSAWELSDSGCNAIVSTVVHEFQHMIHFYQRSVHNGVERLASVLAKWGSSVLPSGRTDTTSRYRYNSGTWFTSIAGDITFQYGSINMNIYGGGATGGTTNSR